MSYKTLYGHSREVMQWVAGRIPGCERGFGNGQAIGVVHCGKIVAGVVYHNWVPENGVIEVSSAAITPRWATRSILTELFDYPFSDLRCRLVVARMSEKNERARKLWRAFGATEHILPDLRADGIGECVSLLKHEAWQESRLNYGKTQGTDTT